ncbi:hypothetical protein BDV97DRAFT_341576 [Delphinella strobiligena]|nr:hypothetical protein BDV97DRAFT_341576 [Delphinella strobiligena]
MPSPLLPPEVWARIAEDCSPKTLKALSLVCRSCSNEARRRLYHSVQFCEGRHWSSPTETPERTRILDLALFYQSLGTWKGWRTAVQEVRLEWSNGVKDAFRDLPASPETEAQLRLNDLVRDTANLVSQSSKLRFLHLSLPHIHSSVPFHVDRIDSLKIPITGCEHETNDPGFATLLKLFQIPLLHRIELDSMLRLCCVVPQSCRQPGTSDVKEIKFIECGPISEELIDLLRWPKDLQSLEFDVAYPVSERAWAEPNAHITSENTINTLSPFKHSIQNLQIWSWEMKPGPYQGGAFQAFSKLRRLRVPRDLFIQLSDDSRNADLDLDVAPAIHTQLPESLQELHIGAGSVFWWRIWEEDEPQDDPPLYERELIALLSGLAETKARCFPELHELHIWHEDYVDRYSAQEQPCCFPPVCDEFRDFVALLQESNINVFFNGVRGITVMDDEFLDR